MQLCKELKIIWLGKKKEVFPSNLWICICAQQWFWFTCKITFHIKRYLKNLMLLLCFSITHSNIMKFTFGDLMLRYVEGVPMAYVIWQNTEINK